MQKDKILTIFAKFTKDLDSAAIISVNVYFLVSLAISSTKISFLFSFIFFAFLVYYYSFYKAMVYSMLPLLYFGLGQIHSFIAVPASAVFSPQYWEGRQLVFSLSPFFIIFLSGLILLIFLWRKINLRFLMHEKMILILFAMFGLSFVGSVMPFISFAFTMNDLLLIVWGIYLVLATKNISKLKVKKILLTLAIIFVAILLQNSLLVFGQIIKGGALGLAIERTEVAPVFGLGADERAGVFRPFGFNIHPNGLANEVILIGISILIMLQYLFEKFTKKNKTFNILVIAVFLVSLLIIILTLSRAAFVAIFLSLLFFAHRHPKQLKKIENLQQRIASKSNPWLKVVIFIVLAVLTFKLTSRLFDTIYSFSELGGVSTRIEQYKEAFEVFKNYPLFGVGVGMFMPASYQLFPDGIMRYFPEPVHNGFLLFLVERGAFGAITYLIFLIYFYSEISKLKLRKLTKTMIYLGIISSFVMMLFHPQNNFLSFLIVFILFIIHYEKTNIKI
ncbi:O-antigen ligase family protein [Candidatus Woesebacteria bacterium]|nr:O-antigen ligase family protein [Candidatus Woesebacteria bacterium]